MTRFTLVALLLAGCGKSTQANDSPPPPTPLSTLTAPPALTLADPATATDPSAAPNADASSPDHGVGGLFGGGRARPASSGPQSTAYERAIEASKEGRSAEVRSLLETKVRAGKASIDEARLVRAACKNMGDRACRDDIDAKYPPIKPPG